MTDQTKLETIILEANEAYREGHPIVEDQEYDALTDLLKNNYPESKLLKKAVLEDKPKTRKVKLPIPMFSLEKKKSVKEIKDWFNFYNLPEDTLLVITPKYDGNSVCYNQETKQAITRGNGVEGQDITKHFKHIAFDGVYTDLTSVVYGEAIMCKRNFEEHYSKDFKAARNLVAGALNRDDINPQILSDIDFMQYGVGDGLLDKLFQLDSSIPYNVIYCKDINEHFLNLLYREWGEQYKIDGLVIDVNSGKLRKQMGRLTNNNPAFAIAYKNPEWTANYTTTVLGIEWNVSKQGKLKPVILVIPTDIDGVIVERVTGYNAKYVIDNNIAKDSEIEIVRSGEVIPKHIKTLSYNTEEMYSMMDEIIECPDCGCPVKWDGSSTELVCTNRKCKGIRLSKMEHFFSTIGVEEFARPSIEQLFDSGYDTVNEILFAKVDDLIKIDGWAEVSATNLVNQFKKLNEVGVCLAKKLHALDVFEGVLGEKTAQLILDNINETLPSVDDLCNIKGVAEITANAFRKGMQVYNDEQLYHLPIKTSYIKTPVKEVSGDKCKDMSVCFTGVRSVETEEKIVENGGKIVSGVSKTTTHLIVKDMTEQTLSSGKSVKAKSLGVEIIALEDFLKKFDF